MLVKICGLTTANAIAAALDAGADALGFVFAPSPREIAPEAAAALCATVPRGIARVAVMHHPDPDLVKRVLAAFAPDWLQTDAEDFSAIELPPTCAALPVYREGRTPFARRKRDAERSRDPGASARLRGLSEAQAAVERLRADGKANGESPDDASASGRLPRVPEPTTEASGRFRTGGTDDSMRIAQLRAALPPRLLFEGTQSGTGRASDWDEARALARATQLVLAGGLHAGNVAAAIERVQPYGVDVSSGVERSRGEKDPAMIKEFVRRVRALEAS